MSGNMSHILPFQSSSQTASSHKMKINHLASALVNLYTAGDRKDNFYIHCNYNYCLLILAVKILGSSLCCKFARLLVSRHLPLKRTSSKRFSDKSPSDVIVLIPNPTAILEMFRTQATASLCPPPAVLVLGPLQSTK